jgi:hypothetical protein
MLLLPLLAVLCACAEGGIRGSGISTSVLGNVASVDPTAPGGLAGIRVVVVGTGVAATTDAAGDFSLVGPFDGVLTLRFAPSGGGTAELPINVPAAGTLTLNNVALDTAQGTAVAESQDVDFDGVVVSTDCAAATMVMDSAVETKGDTDHYVVDLASSTVEDAQGQAVPCEAIPAGAAASLSGHVYPDGVFGHALIVLTP